MSQEQVGLALAGLAGFQLLNAWNNNAPTLAQLRDTEPGDPATRQKLYDADVLVGGTATVIGVGVYLITGDTTPLLLMAATFGAVALWHHRVLNSVGVTNGY